MHRRIVVLLAVSALIFAQCRNAVPPNEAASNLPSSFYTILADKDTLLRTAKGALLAIPKGALGTGSVKLEVKEAYSVADMVLGRLTTMSGKNILSSGGMIYLNAADGGNLSISKPIKVSIPTSSQQPGMKLYKGNVLPDSTVDWVDPVPLPEQELSANLKRGKMLYETKCQSCHHTYRDSVTGPPLALLDERRWFEWVTHWVTSSTYMRTIGQESYSMFIYDHYNRIPMPEFPDMPDQDIKHILEYATYDARDIDPNAIPDIKKSYDSCELLWYMLQEMNKRISRAKGGNPSSVTVAYEQWLAPKDTLQYKPDYVIQPVVQNVSEIKPDLVRVAEGKAMYYQFDVVATGWYNVDILMKELPGFVQSELIAKLSGPITEGVNLFFLLPAQKILTRGGKLSSGNNDHGFYTQDGKLQLPQNAVGLILAMGEKDGQVYFGKTAFVTRTKQTIDIQALPTTRQQMNDDIIKLGLEGIQIAVKDAPNADSVRKIEMDMRALETLRPKNCKCDVGLEPTSDTANLDVLIRKKADRL